MAATAATQQTLPFAAAAANAAGRLRDLGRALRAIGADAATASLCRLVFDQTAEGAAGRTWTATRAQILGHIWGPRCSLSKLSATIAECREVGLLAVDYEPAGPMRAAAFAVNWQGVAAILGHGPFQNLEGALQNLEGGAQNLEGALQNLEGGNPCPPTKINISAHAPAPASRDNVLSYDDDVIDTQTNATEATTEGRATDGLMNNPAAVNWPAAVAEALEIRRRLFPNQAAMVPEAAAELILGAAAVGQALGPDGREWIDRAVAAVKARRPTNAGGYFRGCLVVGLVETLGRHTQAANADAAAAAARFELAEALRRIRPDLRRHLHAIRRAAIGAAGPAGHTRQPMPTEARPVTPDELAAAKADIDQARRAAAEAHQQSRAARPTTAAPTLFQ